ncbi:MAG: multiheme c-type cytochrome [Planctomycetota bacterium]
MTYFRGVRTEGIEPIIVSGGDFLYADSDYKANQVQRGQLREKAKLIIEAYNRYPYDAACVAECDLALGLESLLELKKLCKFPLLCANLVHAESKQLYFQPSVIVQRGAGAPRVGVIGLMPSLRAEYLARVAPESELLPLDVTLRAEIDRLKNDVDMLVLLAHLERDEVDRVADAFPELDVLLEPNSYSGSTSLWVKDDVQVTERNGALVLKLSGQGSHVGRLDFSLGENGEPWQIIESTDSAHAKPRSAEPPSSEPQTADTPASGEPTPIAAAPSVNRYRSTATALAPYIGSDPTFEAMSEAFRKSTRFVSLAQPTDFVPSDRYRTAETCKACHEEQYQFWLGTAHGRAYATLEKTGDEFRYDCMPCHVVGYGETFIDAHKVGEFKNVQCEACHGTNPKHPEAPAEHRWRKADGKLIEEKNCWGCHNPMVTKASFNPAEAIPQVSCPPIKRN